LRSHPAGAQLARAMPSLVARQRSVARRLRAAARLGAL
jgi:hypothetical protein